MEKLFFAIGVVVSIIACAVFDCFDAAIYLFFPSGLLFAFVYSVLSSIDWDKEKVIKVVCITLAIIAIVALIVVCCNSCVNDSGHVDTSTCKSCGRTFEAGDSDGNYKNIARSGMCNNCYDNYKYFEDFVD